MRIAIGGFSHETNTFSSLPVDAALLNQRKSVKEALFSMHGVQNSLGGLLDGAVENGMEIVPAACVYLWPSAPAEKAAFDAFCEEMTAIMWQAHCEKPLDGIALFMHGAGVAQGYDDLEGQVLKVIRERFGNDVPIGLVLDLHGNITPEMVQRSDVIVGYKHYPHTDPYICGKKLTALLRKRITGGKPYAKHFIKLPLHTVPAHGLTAVGGGKMVQDFLFRQLEEEQGLLDITFFHGFPYADIPQAGASVYAVAEDEKTAQTCAEALARFVWDSRREFKGPINNASEAMDQAERSEFPVVINESSDNPGGGAPGDSTHLLREMLLRNLPGTAFSSIYDPETAVQAVNAGIGARIDCLLGAKSDHLHGTPIALKDVLVKAVSHDGVYVKKNPMGAGGKQVLGPTALLEAGNVQIVVSCGRAQTIDDGPFEMLGLDYTKLQLFGLKSANHFKAWWESRVKTVIPCDGPGIHSANLRTLPYKHMNTSYYPFADASWELK